MTKPRVTIQDIATQTGVSLATVSMVLHGKNGIHPDTRQRVLTSAKDLGYQVKKRRQTAAASPVKSVGLVVKSRPLDPPHANPFYSQVLAGIEAYCRPRKINVLFAVMPVDDSNHPVEVPNFVAEADVDGLLFVGAFLDHTLLPLLTQRHLPVVLVDGYSPSADYDAVVSDNLNGAHEAVAYLIQHGHKRIAFAGPRPDVYPSLDERRGGYTLAMHAHGLETAFVTVNGVKGVDESETVLAFGELLQSHPDITAIFAVNDATAIAVLRAARECGLQVPEQLSVVGFDDIDVASLMTPALTTMHVDKTGMGRRAAEMLIDRAQYPDSLPATVVLRPRLVERQSVSTRAEAP